MQHLAVSLSPCTDSTDNLGGFPLSAWGGHLLFSLRGGLQIPEAHVKTSVLLTARLFANRVLGQAFGLCIPYLYNGGDNRRLHRFHIVFFFSLFLSAETRMHLKCHLRLVEIKEELY